MERRGYGRIYINIEGVFTLVDKDTLPRELEGWIENVSERGLKITFNKSTYSDLLDCINVDDTICFQSYDEYEYFGAEKDVIISGNATIVRIEDNEDNIVLGCKLIGQNDMTQYVDEKRTSFFMHQFKDE